MQVIVLIVKYWHNMAKMMLLVFIIQCLCTSIYDIYIYNIIFLNWTKIQDNIIDMYN
jgi:hypothetical protein